MNAKSNFIEQPLTLTLSFQHCPSAIFLTENSEGHTALIAYRHDAPPASFVLSQNRRHFGKYFNIGSFVYEAAQRVFALAHGIVKIEVQNRSRLTAALDPFLCDS